MNLESVDVTAGLGGFLAFFLLAVALYFLMRNMNVRLRRMAYREEQEAKAADVTRLGGALVATGPTGDQGPSEPGYIGGGLTERTELLQGPVITVDVEDIDAALATIEQLGGKAVRPR